MKNGEEFLKTQPLTRLLDPPARRRAGVGQVYADPPASQARALRAGFPLRPVSPTLRA